MHRRTCFCFEKRPDKNILAIVSSIGHLEVGSGNVRPDSRSKVDGSTTLNRHHERDSCLVATLLWNVWEHVSLRPNVCNSPTKAIYIFKTFYDLF